MNTVLSVEKLCKIYPGSHSIPAIDHITFKLDKGEILGLLGPNGSGKTTTIQMLLGTLTPTSGTIIYFGKNFLHHRSEILEKVSFVSTYTNLPWILTVLENLEIFGRLYGLNPKETERRVYPLLERFGIIEKKNERLSSLSAGQLTRLMLVKAFFVHPQVALLDEPTASLDPVIASEICSFLLEQRKENGVSILFSSHKMEEVMEICDRTIFLKEGKIIADDIPSKLAKSVSTFHIRLVIADGMKRTQAIASERSLNYTINHRIIEIAISEEQIPEFINALSQANVSYINIKVDEPSLEDYFLHIARRKS